MNKKVMSVASAITKLAMNVVAIDPKLKVFAEQLVDVADRVRASSRVAIATPKVAPPPPPPTPTECTDRELIACLKEGDRFTVKGYRRNGDRYERVMIAVKDAERNASGDYRVMAIGLNVRNSVEPRHKVYVVMYHDRMDVIVKGAGLISERTPRVTCRSGHITIP